MIEGTHTIPLRCINQIIKPIQTYHEHRSLLFPNQTFKTTASARNDDLSLIVRRRSRAPRRRLITVSTGDASGRWPGKWTCDYILSLQQLQLQDLAEDEQDEEVFINLCVYKHISFGFSVEGRVITSFTRKCSNCDTPYCREIDTTFNVWILPPSKETSSSQIPEIGEDPSVIYVKPGHEADLDQLIQDTIRLATSVNEYCSESCKTSEPKIHYIGQTASGVDGRWSRLLELRKGYS